MHSWLEYSSNFIFMSPVKYRGIVPKFDRIWLTKFVVKIIKLVGDQLFVENIFYNFISIINTN